MPRFGRRSDTEHRPRLSADRRGAPGAGAAPEIIALLDDGPLEGRSIEADAVEGRPPKTLDVAAPDGSMCRYCLAQWEQSGRSALYTFLYRV